MILGPSIKSYIETRISFGANGLYSEYYDAFVPKLVKDDTILLHSYRLTKPILCLNYQRVIEVISSENVWVIGTWGRLASDYLALLNKRSSSTENPPKRWSPLHCTAYQFLFPAVIVPYTGTAHRIAILIGQGRDSAAQKGAHGLLRCWPPPLPCPLHYLGIFLRTLQCKTPECVASSSSSLLHWESSLSPKYVKVVGVVHRLAFVLIFSWWSHVPWGPTQFKQNNLLLALPSEIDDYFLIILKNDGR